MDSCSLVLECRLQIFMLVSVDLSCLDHAVTINACLLDRHVGYVPGLLFLTLLTAPYFICSSAGTFFLVTLIFIQSLVPPASLHFTQLFCVFRLLFVSNVSLHPHFGQRVVASTRSSDFFNTFLLTCSCSLLLDLLFVVSWSLVVPFFQGGGRLFEILNFLYLNPLRMNRDIL